MTIPVPLQQQTAVANVVLNANTAGFNQNMAGAAAQTGVLSRALDGLDSKLKGITARAGHGLLNIGKADFASLGAATGVAADFQKQLGTLSATAALTGTSMNGIKGSVESAFNKFPVSRASVVALTESLTKLGVTGTADLSKLTDTFIKLGAATGEGSQELAAGLVQLSRLMGQSNAQQIGNYANALLTVSAKAGVSATSVLNFAQAIAPLARQAGIGEAAVIGISAAFSKAGADGFVAANTFNTMVSQITSLTQSGSPDLAKYANLIGVTTTQFKSMDKTTALTDIFNAINKEGPAAIDTLNRLGFDGVRTLSSIQAVASSGDLSTQISTALGASGNQGNLNAASKKAFGGLVDAGAQLRNTFTQIATTVGGPLLTPLTILLKVVNLLASGFAQFSKFVPIIALIGGVFATMAGAALIAAGAVAKLALVSLIARSGPLKALREGAAAPIGPMSEGAARPWNAPFFRLGQRVSGGVSSVKSFAADRGAEGEATARARDTAIVASGGRLPFDRTIDENSAQRMQLAASQPSPARRVRGAVLRGGRSLINTQADFIRDASKDGYDRQSPFLTSASRGVTRLGNLLTGKPQPAPEEPTMPKGGLGKVGNAMAGSITSMSPKMGALSQAITKSAEASIAVTKAEAAAAKMTDATTAAQKEQIESTLAVANANKEAAVADALVARKEADQAAAAAFANKSLLAQSKDLGVAFGKLSVANAGAGLRMGATVAGKGLSAVAGAAGGIASSVGPIGALALGVPLLMGLQSKISAADNAGAQVGGGDNSVSKYDALLGQTSNNLATFSTAVLKAAGDVGGTGGATPTLADAATITSADTNKVSSSYKVTDSHFETLAKVAPTNTKAAVAYIQTLATQKGGMNPDTLGAVKDDLIKTYGATQAATILQSYLATNPSQTSGTSGIDYQTLGGTVNGASNGRFKGILDQGTSSIVSANQINPGTQSSQAQLGSLLNLGYGSLKGSTYASTAGGSNLQSYEAELERVYGVKAGTLRLAQGDQSGGGGSTDASVKAEYGSQDAFNKMVVTALLDSPQGKAIGASVGLKPGGVPTSDQINVILSTQTPTAAQSPVSQADSSVNRTGDYLENSPTVAAAVAAPSDPSAQFNATQALLATAQTMGGSLAGVNDQLDQIEGVVKDTNDPRYAIAAAAKAQAATNYQQFTQPNQSGAANLNDATAGLAEAQKAQAQSPTDDTAATLASAQANYASQLTAQQQFEVQSYQSLLAYQVQQTRATEDYNLQVSQSKADFQTQQGYAQHDYDLQTLRAQQDFATQMSRQAQTDAQSIYNPYQRIQYQLTSDAGTLLQNLTDQNSKIADQMANLNKLSNLGINQQTINTLDLANPTNAQQTNELVSSLTQNPALVAQINAAVASRLASTTALTQSSFSMTYTNTTADFALQISRGATDFATSTDRAVDAQTLALSRMDIAFKTTATRSAQDLQTTFGQMLASLSTSLGQATSGMSNVIGGLPPALAGDYQTAFAQIASDGIASYKLLQATATAASGTPAGTFGINASGDYGYYTTAGVFVKDKAYVSQMTYNSAPSITPPGHATGGISQYAHTAAISEGNNPEAIIPLTGTGGLDFMTGFVTQVSMAMVRQMQTSALPGMPSGETTHGTTTYSVDQSSNFNGPVTVQASDPDAMAKALQAKSRLARLARPTASTAGV